MTKIEMLEKIEIIQPYIDSLIEKNYVKFLNPATEIPILEELYNEITSRKYLRFNSGCGSCIKEALIICDNYRKKAIKELEAEALITHEQKEIKEAVKTPTTTKPKPTKPKSNVKRTKPTK